MKPWKKVKPPLNVQKHSSGNGITVTRRALALAKTVEKSCHEDSTGFYTRGDEG